MAKPRSNDPIEPMDLANMRHNGVRSLAVQCHQCRHEVVTNVDHLPGGLTVPSFGPRMVCTKCGTIGADVRPNLAGTRDVAGHTHNTSMNAPRSWVCVSPHMWKLQLLPEPVCGHPNSSGGTREVHGRIVVHQVDRHLDLGGHYGRAVFFVRHI
jgi:hypothetical protein